MKRSSGVTRRRVWRFSAGVKLSVPWIRSKTIANKKAPKRESVSAINSILKTVSASLWMIRRFPKDWTKKVNKVRKQPFHGLLALASSRENILWAKNFPDISNKGKKDVKGVCFKYQGYFDVMEIKKYQLKQADDGIWWVQFSTWRTTCLPFKWPLRGKLRKRSIFFLIMTGCIAVLGMYNSQVSYIFNRPVETIWNLSLEICRLYQRRTSIRHYTHL